MNDHADRAHRDERRAEHLTDTAGHPTDCLTAALRSVAELISRTNEPATRMSVRLGPAAFGATIEDRGQPFASLTVHNQGPVSVYLSAGGEVPRAGTGAVEVQSGAMVTLPIRNERIELGIDAADWPAVLSAFAVDIYRYRTVQPAAIHAPNVGVVA